MVAFNKDFLPFNVATSAMKTMRSKSLTKQYSVFFGYPYVEM